MISVVVVHRCPYPSLFLLVLISSLSSLFLKNLSVTEIFVGAVAASQKEQQQNNDVELVNEVNDDDDSRAGTVAEDISIPNVTITKIAFGSCHKRKYAIRNDLSPSTTTNIWDTIATTQDPDIFVWMGDAVYPPSRKIASVESLQEEYHHLLYNESLGYKHFQPRHGIYGTWDDHDYGGNDMGISMPNKYQRAKAFLQFVHAKNHLQHYTKTSKISSSAQKQQQRQGIYQSIVFGEPPHQIKILLLDTRWHRTNHCIPSVSTYIPLGAGLACLTRWLTAGLLLCSIRNHWFSYQDDDNHDTLLGKEQWDWLQTELQRDTAPPQLYVIVSSIQVLTTNPVMESWGHYPNERRRLLQLIRPMASRVILLSGDVHHAEILDPNAYQYYNKNTNTNQNNNKKNPHATTPTRSSSSSSSFLEVTSSGLTHECSKHLYGALCQPLLEIFSHHRYRGNNNNYNILDAKKNTTDAAEKYYYIGRNYGMIHVDWQQQTFRVDVHSLETTTTANGSDNSNNNNNMYNQVVLTTGPRSFVGATTGDDVLDVDQVLPCLDGHLIPIMIQMIGTVVLATIVVIWLFQYRGRRGTPDAEKDTT